MYLRTAHWPYNRGNVLDLSNEAVPLPADYVAVFSGRTDAPVVRCDLTDRRTDLTTVTLAALACRGLMTVEVYE